MKVAIVHDFLMQMGGAEKVVEVLHSMYPNAPIYTSAYDPEAMPAHYRQWDIRTTFMQRLPMKRRTHRAALLLYPIAFEMMDLSAYDLVISSSSAFAKGIITQPDTRHICYTHAPMRYAWSSGTYIKNERASRAARVLLAPAFHYLRTWDAVASSRVDSYIANSTAVARRIKKFYGRDSEVICPPVDTERFAISKTVEDYAILVSRFVPYKRLDLAVEAFSRMDRRLKIVGDGRCKKTLQKIAGPTIEFLGHVPEAELPGLLARASMFLMPGEEDFGIAPVEANACGRPVVAYARGGALDSQVDGVTGVLFQDQTVESLCAAVACADRITFDPEIIRASAMRFSTAAFVARFERLVMQETSVDSGTALAGRRILERVAR